MVNLVTVTGRITIPQSDTGLPARVVATPMTKGNVLKVGDRLTIGPVRAVTDAAGNLPASGDNALRIPTDHGIPELLWEIVAHPTTSRHIDSEVKLGYYEITGAGTLQALVQVDQTLVKATAVASLQALVVTVETEVAGKVTQAETARAGAVVARTAAETARDDAQAARDTATGIALGDAEAALEGFQLARGLPATGAELFAQTGAQIAETVVPAFGALPAAYIDPRALPNGPITEITHGQFSASFGNSPAVINGGVITHTPSGPSNTACYIQTLLPGPVGRIGMIVDFPTGTSGGAATVLIPAGSWAGGITNSGVHVTITGGTGTITSARYVSGALAGSQSYSLGSPLTGRHMVEVGIDHRRKEITVWLDGVRVLKYVDTVAWDYLSNYAIWELYEFTGTSLTPAIIRSAWADVERLIPAQLPVSDVQPQRTLFATSWNPGTLADYALGNTSAAIGMGTLTGVPVPKSGKLLTTYSCWLDATGIDPAQRIFASVDAQGARCVAMGGFVGAVTVSVLGVGYAPDTNVTLTPRMWAQAGTTAKVRVGGAFGAATMWSQPAA